MYPIILLNYYYYFIYIYKARMKAEGVYEIPQIWTDMWAKHSVDPKIQTISQLALDFSMPESEVKHILKKMKSHSVRLTSQLEHEADLQEYFEEAQEIGCNTEFEELPVLDRLERMDAKYEPQILKDDLVEEAKLKLLKRIERETKAKVSYDINIFLAAQARAKESQHVAEAEARPARSAEGEERLARFKIAFRDISSRAQAERQPTMIRTRSGE